MWAAWLAIVMASLVLQTASGQLTRPEELTPTSSGGAFYMHRETCESAHFKCMNREVCRQALQKYWMRCSFSLEPGVVKSCPEPCLEALVMITSTAEGRNFMNCRCTDEECSRLKRRAEICRPQVEEAIREDSVVSCRVAEWICAADPVCSNALNFYHRLCKAMFQGIKCNHRCNNSVDVLLRQDKSAKLATCVCDGRENYNCQIMRDNLSDLCLHKFPTPPSLPPASVDTNEVVPAAAPNAHSCTLVLALIAPLLVFVLAAPT